MILPFYPSRPHTCPEATRLAAKLYDLADSAHGWAADLIGELAREVQRRATKGVTFTRSEADDWLRRATALKDMD